MACACKCHAATSAPQEESYYARHRDQRLEYQRRYNALHRHGERQGVSKGKKPVPATPVTGGTVNMCELSGSDSAKKAVVTEKEALSTLRVMSNPFYRFSGAIAPTQASDLIYDNTWTLHGETPDPERNHAMIVAESRLVLDLSFLESDLRESHGNEWVQYFRNTLSDWIQTELLRAEDTRRSEHGSLRAQNLHAHRRTIAGLCQERDLLRQSIVRGHEDVPQQYLQDAIFRGHAILNGARVNRKLFHKTYGF